MSSQSPRSGSARDPRMPVAVLGATGIVGQRLVRMLAGHPSLRLAEVAASSRSAGRRYADVVQWSLTGDIPDTAAGLPVRAVRDRLRSRLVLSALPRAVATDLELDLARAGHVVCSNASAHRQRADVPLIVPEINAGDLERVQSQPWFARRGALVTNPNCAVVGVALALAPIERSFGIEEATLVTLQALSGAGLNGTGAVRMSGNVVPWISGEAEKIGPELNKILGSRIRVAASTNRVPVLDGHMAHVFLKLRTPAGRRRPSAACSTIGHAHHCPNCRRSRNGLSRCAGSPTGRSLASTSEPRAAWRSASAAYAPPPHTISPSSPWCTTGCGAPPERVWPTLNSVCCAGCSRAANRWTEADRQLSNSSAAAETMMPFAGRWTNVSGIATFALRFGGPSIIEPTQ